MKNKWIYVIAYFNDDDDKKEGNISFNHQVLNADAIDEAYEYGDINLLSIFLDENPVAYFVNSYVINLEEVNNMKTLEGK